MTEGAENGGARGRALWPAVRSVAPVDLLEVLAAGLGDFRRAPLYGLFFGAIYALGGWLLIILLLYAELPFLVYPLAADFAGIMPGLIAARFFTTCLGITAILGNAEHNNCGICDFLPALLTREQKKRKRQHR